MYSENTAKISFTLKWRAEMDQSPFIVGGEGKGRILGGITRFSDGIEGGSVYRGYGGGE